MTERTDTERLDWLSKPRPDTDGILIGVGAAGTLPGTSLYVEDRKREPYDAPTLRDAIDRAMSDDASR